MSGKKQQGMTGNLLFAISAGAIGSAFQHGYNTGVTNAPQPLVEKFINETYTERYGEPADKETIEFIFSLIVAVFCVGGMAGALSTSFFADKIGRKGGLLYNNILVLLATLCLGFCTKAKSYEMLIVGRFIIGFNSGLNAGLSPMFLSEISPANLRGSIGTVYQLVITISIVISQVLGFPELLGTEELWPVLFSVIIIPAIFMVVTLPFCPESPKHILIIQNKDVAAQRALTWLRGTVEVHDEMEEMRNEVEQMKLVPKVTMREMWTNPVLRQPLVIAMVVMLSQQLSGINAAIAFSGSIFRSAGLTGGAPLYATLGMGFINVVMTVISLILVEKAGRRTLLLTGLGGMAVTTVVLTFCLTMKDRMAFLSYVSIVAVYFFVIMFATGPGSIPWFLVSEMFGVGARGLATSLAVACNWSANFLVFIAFLPLSTMLGDWTFLVFTVILVVCWIYAYKKVPETKGKTAEEVAAVFRQQSYQ